MECKRGKLAGIAGYSSAPKSRQDGLHRWLPMVVCLRTLGKRPQRQGCLPHGAFAEIMSSTRAGEYPADYKLFCSRMRPCRMHVASAICALLTAIINTIFECAGKRLCSFLSSSYGLGDIGSRVVGLQLTCSCSHIPGSRNQ